jgi:hypothetical protein
MRDEVIKVPTVATVSCKAYRERIHELEAERDQLREALEAIVNYPDLFDCYTPEEMQDIARIALVETEAREVE